MVGRFFGKTARGLINKFLKKINLKAKGTVKKGWGASSRQEKVYTKRIEEKTGIKVFPGTLNLDIDRDINFRNGLRINTKLGTYWLFPITINGMPAYAVKPPRAKNCPKTLEVMSELSLRKSLRLEDGFNVDIKIKKYYVRKNNSLKNFKFSCSQRT